MADCSSTTLGMQVALARHVFVGTVIFTGSGGESALVAVDRKLIGKPLPPLIEVHSPSAWSPGRSSLDRTFDSGTTYVFVLYTDPPSFEDYACGATMPYSDAVAVHLLPNMEPRIRDPRVIAEQSIGQITSVSAVTALPSAILLLAFALWLAGRSHRYDVRERR